MFSLAHWQEAEVLGTWRWPRFSPEKMACRCCGCVELDPDFMDRLTALRKDCGFPLIETSGYRCPKHNASVSSTGKTGPHTTGHAIDIQIYGARADRLLALSYQHGFTGRGIRQTGDYRARFIHLDDLDNGADSPRPRVWSY